MTNKKRKVTNREIYENQSDGKSTKTIVLEYGPGLATAVIISKDDDGQER